MTICPHYEKSISKHGFLGTAIYNDRLICVICTVEGSPWKIRGEKAPKKPGKRFRVRNLKCKECKINSRAEASQFCKLGGCKV